MDNFYLNMTLTFVASGLVWILMSRVQARKQREADEKFAFTMRLIEMRNRKHGDDYESKK